MSEAKHTPGPWRIHDMEDDAIVAERVQGVRGGAEVANVARSCWPENIEADARLIAAAPELLAALQGCIAYRNWELAEGGVVPQPLIGTFKRAEATIAKATGAA